MVASASGVVLGCVAEAVGSNLARGKIFTASIGSVDSLYPTVYIYIGMPGIPYVLEYVKNILNIRYARNTLCAGICEEHIEHKVCQEYLMCWNM